MGRSGMNACSLVGKRCVVTGATSGIGYATVEALLGLGAEVIFVGHDPERTAKAAKIFAAQAAKAKALPPRQELADLSLMAEVKDLASRLVDSGKPIDVLVNCAGIYTAKRTLTPEGLEMQFAVNHLAPFLLTTSLLPAMRAESRIATVSSGSHYYGWIRWKDPSLAGHYFGLWAYEQSKLANVLFSYELARRFEGGMLRMGFEEPRGGQGATVKAPRPTVFAIDPGLVNTEMGQKHARGLTGLFWSLRRRGGASPARPAAGIAALVSSAEAAGRTGLYWRDAVPLRSSRRSYDAAAAERLWELSETIVEGALRGGSRGAYAEKK